MFYLMGNVHVKELKKKKSLVVKSLKPPQTDVNTWCMQHNKGRGTKSS